MSETSQNNHCPNRSPLLELEGARKMGRVNLEVRCPKKVGGIALDPDPDWSFDSLLSELSGLEKKLTYSLKISSPTAETDARDVSQSKNKQIPKAKKKDGGSKAFVVRVSDEDWEIDNHVNEKALVAAGRSFGWGELFLSDDEDSEDDSMIGSQIKLMPPVGVVEATLSEITNDRQLSITDEIRRQKMDLEMSLMTENEKFASNLTQIEKQAETKRELERRYDLQYQRRIAEALDTHMIAIQRDREHKSQIEERRIRDDAVREEAQRRERASHEEKLRQEKIEAEAQVRLEAERVEAAKAAALEAERRAAEEAAQKKTSTLAGTPATGNFESTTEATTVSRDPLTLTTQNAQSTGNLIKGAETALNLENRRLKIYEELSAKNNAWRMGSNMDYITHEKNIKRSIRTMRGSEDNVRKRAEDLLNLINHPSFPQSISIMMFVDAIVAQCNKPTDNRTCYAYGQSAVLVSSMVPLVMDMLIAKLNKVCIYTVPKHITHSKSAFETNDAYYKAIGFQQEDDGRNESTDSFLERMTSCMKLYGAIVQTEIMGIQNPHGLEEGWAWLARFLNALPPNLFTAVALHSFIQMAGYAMYKRFRVQFVKMVDIITREFVEALREDLKSTTTVVNFRHYLNSKQFLKEPEERVSKAELLSNRDF